MTLPASGNSISLQQTNVELGNTGTDEITMGSADVRGLFGVSSGAIDMSDGFGQSAAVWYGSRGIFMGGQLDNSGVSNTISYVTIANTGNASDFGDLVATQTAAGGCSDGSRGLSGGGYESGGSPYRTDRIDYLTIANTGNASDFGNLTQSRKSMGCLSDGSRGVFAGGGQSSFNIIDYVTVANTGNASDFGDMLAVVENISSAYHGGRGVFYKGPGDGNYTQGGIQYITVATTGNAQAFGWGLVTTETTNAGCSSAAGRGIFGGGNHGASGTNPPYTADNINYVTIANTGDATDFGNLTVYRYYGASSSDGSRGIFGGGYGGVANQSAGRVNVIDYITIANTGNATDFGDLTQAKEGPPSACSGT